MPLQGLSIDPRTGQALREAAPVLRFGGIAALRKFNEAASGLDDTVVVNVSMDLPFAQKRFCESEGLKNVKNLSGFRSPGFGTDYGITMIDGALRGLYGRAVVVVDPKGTVVHTELVP